MSDGSPGIPGRVSVATRALHRVFSAVAAEELGTAARDVSARVWDDTGRLGVTVEGPARRVPGAPSLIDIGDRTRTAVGERGGRIAGVEVGRVTVRITDTTMVKGRVT